MNESLLNMTSLLFRASWQAAILAIIVLIATGLLRDRVSARFRYILWSIVLLRCALIFAPHSPVSLFGIFQEPEAGVHETYIFIDPQQAVEHPELVDMALPQSTSPERSSTIFSAVKNNSQPFWLPLTIIWAIGVILLLLRQGRLELILFRSSRQWHLNDDPEIQNLFEQCRREVGLWRKSRLLVTSDKIGAAATGTLFPTVLINQNMLDLLSLEHLRLVFIHELKHLRSFDPLMHRLAGLLTILHWPNPLIWLSTERLSQERELAIDSAVVTHDQERMVPEYARVILTASEQYERPRPLAGLVGVFGKNHFLQRRIEMIISRRKLSRSWSVVTLCGILMLACTGLTNAGDDGKADNKSKVNLRDDFDGEPTLDWKILRPDPSHYSYDTNKGKLTITTRRGSIHRTTTPGNEAKNMFLLDNPTPDGDFKMTLMVDDFDPIGKYHQVALLCYADDDNYVKFSYEYSWRPNYDTGFLLVRENKGLVSQDLSLPRIKMNRFWIQLIKRGRTYECCFSLNGKDFTSLGKKEWGDGNPPQIGFLAKNGGNSDAEEIDAVFDYFEFKSLPKSDKPIVPPTEEELSPTESYIPYDPYGINRE